jgi:hypothetical protein
MQFHILSFEEPDGYSRAGGIASRVSGLGRSLTGLGFEPHLWFVGDPYLAGHEGSEELELHRWCQWISRYHPGGAYDGEEGRQRDYASSLPLALFSSVLQPHLEEGGQAVVPAEEWQTVDALLHLDWLLRRAGMRSRVKIFWNANNTFGFDRIDWARLSEAAVITTVSRYMKHIIWHRGVNPVVIPIVIPNGLSDEAFVEPDSDAVRELRRRFKERLVLPDPSCRGYGQLMRSHERSSP